MMRRGLGDTDVSALATLFANNEINPTFNYPPWQPAYATAPENIPENVCVDDATARQIVAALPGASLVKRPAMNLQGQVPDCWWIQTADGGLVNAGDVADQFKLAMSIPGKSLQCGWEQVLSQLIPGGVQGSDCAQNSNYGYNPATGDNTVFIPTGGAAPTNSAVPVQTTPAQTSFPLQLPPQPKPASVVGAPLPQSAGAVTIATGTPGASVQPQAGTQPAAAAGAGSIPWYLWAAAAGVAFLMFKG